MKNIKFILFTILFLCQIQAQVTKVRSVYDFGGREIRNVSLQKRASPPSGYETGWFWYDTASSCLRVATSITTSICIDGTNSISPATTSILGGIRLGTNSPPANPIPIYGDGSGVLSVQSPLNGLTSGSSTPFSAPSDLGRGLIGVDSLGVIKRMGNLISCILFVNSSNEWQVMNDGAHRAQGCSGAATTPDGYGVRVFYSKPLARVSGFVTSPDDSSVLQGLMIGPSMGLTFTDLTMRFHAPVSFGISYNSSTSQFEPNWGGLSQFSSLFSFSWTGTALRITTPARDNAFANAVTPIYSGITPGYDVRVRYVTPTVIDVAWFNEDTGVIVGAPDVNMGAHIMIGGGIKLTPAQFRVAYPAGNAEIIGYNLD